MIIFLAGDVYGEITRLYDKVLDLESKLNVTADWVLQTGNLGVYPDPIKIDRALRTHDRKVDFYKYYLGMETIPRPTLFVPGKHEDHRWLKFMFSRGQFEIVPNLTFLLNGYRTYIGSEELSVVGLGRVFSPKTYHGDFSSKSAAHYTRREVERACSQGPVDILLTHEAGYGIQFEGRPSEAEGINNIASALRPALHVHGKYDITLDYAHPVTGANTKSLRFGEVRAIHWHQGLFTELIV